MAAQVQALTWFLTAAPCEGTGPPGEGDPTIADAADHELLLIEVGPDAAPMPRGRRLGMYHFGVKVGDSDDELRAVLARIREAGVTIVGATDHTVTHSLYVLDPDGNELELYIDVPGIDWRADPRAVMSPPQTLAL